MKKALMMALVIVMPLCMFAQDAVKHFVGEHFGGGIVFYVAPNGQHGLIAEIQDQATEIRGWLELSAYFGDPQYLSSEGKNYTDWRLPTYSELQMLYAVKDIVGGFSTKDRNCYITQILLGSTATIPYCEVSFKTGEQDEWARLFSIRVIRSF